MSNGTVNKVIILGRLGKDPEVKYMPNGNAVCNFTVATSEKYKDKSGQNVEQTEWHKVVLFGKVAEIAGEYLRKGRLVYVDGKITTRKWQNKEGVDQYTTEIVGRDINLIPDGSSQQKTSAKTTSEYAQAKAKGDNAVVNKTVVDAGCMLDDDIPF